MTKLQPVKSSGKGAPGVKALVTAASLAVTIGGWAVLARSEPAPAETPTEVPSAVAFEPRPASDFALPPLLLPTVMPPPPSAPELAIASPPHISADLLNGGAHPMSAPVERPAAPAPVAQPVAAPAAQPAVAPAAPVAAPQPLPVASAPLRSVSAPPKPVTRTRSSR